MLERRKQVRRQADREFIQTLEEQKKRLGDSLSKEERHKRRRAIRHNCSVHIALRIQHSVGDSENWTIDEFPMKGRILDLSAEGCQLFTAQDLQMAQEMSLIIGLQHGGRIQAGGLVRWTKAIPDRRGFASGVQFSRISQKDQKALGVFLKDLDRTIGL